LTRRHHDGRKTEAPVLFERLMATGSNILAIEKSNRVEIVINQMTLEAQLKRNLRTGADSRTVPEAPFRTNQKKKLEVFAVFSLF